MEQEKKKSKLKIIIPIVAVVIIAVVGIIIFTRKNTNNTGESIFNNETYYHIGDTVSTDIAEFTLNDSKLTIALSNTNDETYFTPREYDATRDGRNPYVASTGHTLVYVDFTLSAIDRSSVNVNDTFEGSFYKIKYNGKTNNGNFKIGLKKVTSSNYLNEIATGKWEKHTTTNILISSGGQSQYRAYAEIESDNNLKDKCYITFNLPNSEGKKTPFTYVINE